MREQISAKRTLPGGLLTRNTSPAQLVACGSCAIKTRAADCFSMTRLKRNHELRGTLRTTRSGIPLMSTATSLKPPLCNKMSATLNACSRGGSLTRLLPHLTHNSRGKWIPAACPEAGSKQSPASTKRAEMIAAWPAPAKKQAPKSFPKRSGYCHKFRSRA